VASPPDALVRTRLRYEIGDTIGIGRIFDDLAVARCPRPPMGRSRIGTLVTFVSAGSAASRAELRELAARYPDGGEATPRLVLVVDGADQEQADALGRELGQDVIAYADTTGQIADRFGVGVWPTSLAMDGVGRVTALAIGAVGPQDTDTATAQRPPDRQVSAD
jgi:hypothetical protein